MKQLLNIRRLGLIALSFALCSVAAFAEQPTLSASFSRDSVEVGDQFDYIIEIDGGISAKNAGEVFAAGAEALVAGSSVFGAADPEQAIVDMLNS